MRHFIDHKGPIAGAAMLERHRCSLFLSRGIGGKGVEGWGRQDKGNASGQCLSDCLHVFFYGGMGLRGEQDLLTPEMAAAGHRHGG